MRKTIFAVLMIVVIATTCIAWAADTSCKLTWVWEYSCNDPIEEDFDFRFFGDLLNGHVVSPKGMLTVGNGVRKIVGSSLTLLQM